MQRIAGLLAALAAIPGGPGTAQQAAGTALWRLAATTLPLPPALATGTAAVFWNPAQIEDSARTQLGLEGIETPDAVGASGVIAAVRVRAGSVGQIGFVYGHVGLSDLTRTGDSPDPIGSAVPVYTNALGVTWSRPVAGAAVGATLAYHETRLDATRAARWTIDVGASRDLAPRLRVAAATHFFSSLSARDPAQDVYAGVEYRLWEGPLWGDRAVVRGRYGLTFGHGFAADHQVGGGIELGRIVALDLAVTREGSYGMEGWRTASVWTRGSSDRAAGPDPCGGARGARGVARGPGRAGVPRAPGTATPVAATVGQLGRRHRAARCVAGGVGGCVSAVSPHADDAPGV